MFSNWRQTSGSVLVPHVVPMISGSKLGSDAVPSGSYYDIGGVSSVTPLLCYAKWHLEGQGPMAVRRLYEPLCIAFGTAVSSPTEPTYHQLYDLPHKFTPRLYMESEDPNLVLREIGVWAGWEQAGSANTRLFLLDLLTDEDAHDNFHK